MKTKTPAKTQPAPPPSPPPDPPRLYAMPKRRPLDTTLPPERPTPTAIALIAAVLSIRGDNLGPAALAERALKLWRTSQFAIVSAEQEWAWEEKTAAEEAAEEAALEADPQVRFWTDATRADWPMRTERFERLLMPSLENTGGRAAKIRAFLETGGEFRRDIPESEWQWPADYTGWRKATIPSLGAGSEIWEQFRAWQTARKREARSKAGKKGGAARRIRRNREPRKKTPVDPLTR